MGVLKSRHHPIQPEVEAELEEVHIVRVVNRSLRALYGEVDRVEADGDFAFQRWRRIVPNVRLSPWPAFCPWDGSGNAMRFPDAAGWTGGCKHAG